MKKYFILILFISLSIFVNAQSPPTSSDNTVTGTEDNILFITYADFNYNDPDGQAMDYMELRSNVSVGILFNDINGNNIPDGAGEILTSNETISRADLVAGQLKFEPVADGNGAPYANFDFRVVDNGIDPANTSIDYTMTIDITPVNDNPTCSDNAVNCYENDFVIFNAAHFNFSDIDGDILRRIRVTQVPADGVLFNDANLDGIADAGEILGDGSIVTRANIDANRLKYRPTADENGSPYTTFDFRVQDNGTNPDNLWSLLPASEMEITVLSVNSEPSFVLGANQVIFEDAGAQSVNNWATAISEGAPDEGGQNLTFTLTADIPALFSVQPAVDPSNGRLTYTPAPDMYGLASVTIFLSDDGGTANGGDDTSPSYIFTIDIQNVNDAPFLIVNNPLNINEGDINQVIPTGLFEYGDIDNTPSELVYTITSAPSSGTLYLSGTPLAVAGTFTQAHINTNAVTYSHDGSEGAADLFRVNLTDGTANLGPITFNIVIAPVNDAPVFTSSPVTTGDELVPYLYNITATDDDGNPLSFASIVTPPWLILNDLGGGIATLSGVPPSGGPMNVPVSISVTDGIAPPVIQSWNIIISSSAIPDAGVDDVTCTNNEYTLSGNVPPVGYTGLWSLVSGGGIIAAPASNVTLVTGLNSGLAPNNSNTFRWTFTNGDGSIVVWDDVVITNNTVVASVTDLFDVCGTNATLQADFALNPGESGLWTVEGAPVPLPTIVTPNNRTTAVTGLNFNLNQFRWTVTKETCSDFAIMDVWVIEVWATASAPAEICSEPFTIEGNDPALLGGTGLWTVGAGGGIFANNTDPTTTVTGSNQNVINEYIWTVTVNGCQASASVFVENNMPSTAVITTPDPSTSCDGTYTIVAVPADAGDPNEAGYWTTATPGVIIATPNAATTLVTNLQEGANLFTWHITNGTCPESTANLTINYLLPTIVDAGPDAVICENFYSLAGTPLEPGETGLWTVNTGSGVFVNDNSANTVVNNIGRGLNIYEWTVTNDICSGFDQVSITNLSVDAIINTPDPQEACADPWPIQANDPAGFNTANPPTVTVGLWTVLSGGSTVDFPNNNNTTVSNLDPGNNTYMWTLDNGTCTDSDTITIINNIPTPADAGLDTIVCSATLPNLSGNSNYDPFWESGFWRVIAGSATITDPSLFNSSVTNLDYNCTPWTPDWWTSVNAVNVFEWVIQRGSCESTDQVRVLNGLPEAPHAGLDQTVCDNTVDLDALDEASCTQEHWWEQLPDVGDFFDPLTGAFIPDNDLNMPFNTVCQPIQNGMTQFVWHKRNNFLDSGGNPIVCHLTDTVEITSLGLIEDIQAGPEDATCENFYQLNATPPEDVFGTPPPFYVTSGQWTTIFGNGNFDDDTYYNTWVRNMAAYDNIYRWTVTNHTMNCITSDDVYIHSARPSNANAGPDDITCNDFAVLSSNVPVRYTSAYWTVAVGGATIIQNSCTGFTCDAIATNIADSLNIFVWHVVNEYTGGFGGYDATNPLVCEVTDTTEIIFRGVNADAGVDQYVCADFATLGANDPVWNSGLWTTGSGTFASTGTNTSTLFNDIINGLTPGKNTFTWTIYNESCNNSDQLIVFGLLPPPPFANVDQTICISDVDLNANDVSNYWSVVDPVPPNPVWQEATTTGFWTANVPAVTFDDASNFNTTAHNLPAGGPVPTVFTWHSLNNFTDYVAGLTRTCELTDDMNVYNNSVTAEAGTGWQVCGVQGIGATTTLGATPVFNPQSGQWTAVFAPGATIVDNTAFDTEVINMLNGDHIYRWTVSSTLNSVTCTAEDFVTIPVRIPTTAVVAVPSTYEICEDFTTLQANFPNFSIGENGLWEEIPFVTTATIADPTNNVSLVSGILLGTRQFRWTIDNDGCTSDDIITVNNNMVLSDADDRIGDDAILHGVADNDTSICQDWYVLSATDPNMYNTGAPPFPTGIWTAFPGTVTFDNDTEYNTTVRNLNDVGTQISNLIWTVTKGGCIEASTLDITNNEFTTDAHTANVSNIDETCDGNFILSGEQPPAGGSGFWTVVSGGGTFVNQTLYNTQVTGVSKPFSVYQWNVSSLGCNAVNQVTINNNQVSSSAGFDQSTCFDFTTLNGGVPNAGESGQWIVSLGGSTVTNPTLFNSGVTNMVQGQNRFIWRITLGACFAEDEVEVVNNEPDDFSIEADKDVCTINSSISVNPAPAYGTGIWSILAGGGSTAITDPTAIVTAVTDLQPGSNIFQWTVNNIGCLKSDDIEITNNIVISDAGIPQFLCEDYGNLLAADPTVNFPFQGTGTWSVVTGGATVVTLSAFNSPVTDLDPGLNTFRWTMQLGTCIDTDDADITNNSVLANATDQISCDNTAVFDGNNPGSASGLWTTVGSSGTPVITDPTLNISSVTNLGAGINTFRWLVNNTSGCSDSIDIQIDNGYFTISAGPNDAVCGSDYPSMGGEEPGVGNPGVSGFWYVVAGGATVTNSAQFDSGVTGMTPGDNIFRWVVTSPICSAFDEVTIVNSSPTNAQILLPIITNREICTNTVAIEGTNPVFGSGQWTISTAGASFTDDTNFQTTVNNLDPGDNIITWTITNGLCVDDDVITITNNEVTAVAGLAQILCTDNTFLNATDPGIIYPFQGTGYWTNLSGNGAIIANSLMENSAVTNLPIGTTVFGWTVEQGICLETDNVQITNSSVTASATDQSDCTSDFTLNGNDPSTFGGTGYWEIIAGSGTITAPSTQYDTQVTGIPNGATTTLQWTVDNGTCTDAIQISVSNNTFSVSAGPDQTICTDNITMNGDDPLTGVGSWVLMSGSGTFDDTNLNTANVTNIGQGANIYRWTIVRDGCTNFDDVTITNNSPSTALITGPIITETCDGTITLTANFPAPYYADNQYWELVSGNATFNDPSTSFTMNITNLAPGDNIFKWAIERGTCDDSEDFITISNNEVVAVAGADQTICTDATLLNATDPLIIYPNQGIGHWSNLSGNGAIIANSLLENTGVSNLPNGTTTFQWTVEMGSCSESELVQITNNSVTASATDISGCNSDYTLNGNDPSTFGGTGYWEILSGSGAITAPSTQYDTQVTGIPNGATTTLQWTVENGTCTDAIQISVSNNNFSVSAGPDQTICTDNIILNGDDPLTGTGYWTLFSGSGVFSNSTDRNTNVTGINQGTSVYTWTVTRNGCTNADDVTIINNAPSTALITGPIVTETCDGTIVLTADFPAPYYADNQYWELVSGNATFNDPSTSFTMNITNLAPGDNIFKWAIERGTCDDSEDFITISNNEVVAVAGADQTICSNAALLNATDPLIIYPNQGIGHWSNLSGNGAIIANSLLENTGVSNLPNGITTFQWTVELGSCSESELVQITNRSVTASATDIAGCNSDYTLNGNDPSTFGGTGYWEIIAGTGTITAPSTQYDTDITGIAYNTTSTLQWTVTNGTCSDNITITVTNNNFPISAGPDVSDCIDSYTFNADDPAPGTGFWTLIGGNGVISNSTQADAVVTGLAQGNNIFRWTVTRGICTNFDDISIENTNPDIALITAPGPANREVCVNSVTVQGNTPSFGSGQWTVNSGAGNFATPTNFQTLITNMDPGPNTYTWTITNGLCFSSADITIINNAVAAEAGPTQYVCIDTTSLNALSPTSTYPFHGTGAWTYLGAGGVVIENSLSETTAVSGLPNGTNTFRWTVTMGICSTFDDVFIINSTVNANATDALTCDGDILLTGNIPAPGETGNWTCYTPGVTYDDQTLYNTGAHNLVIGTNTFVWSLDNTFCQDSAIITVDYIDPVAVAGPDQDVCSDNTFLAGLSPAPGSGTWSVLTGSGNFANPSNHNTFVTNVGFGSNVYVWTVVDRGCVKTDAVTITNNLPVASAGSDLLTCFDNAVLPAIQELPGETGLWSKIGGTGIITTPTLYNSTVTNLSSGVNVFQWTVNNGLCDNSDEVSIYNNEITSISAGIDRAVCSGSTSMAALAPGLGESGTWDALSGSAIFANSALYNTGVTNLSQGDNILEWTLTNGTCSASDIVIITNNSPTIANVSPDVEICSSTYTLLGNAPNIGESGIWTNEFGAQGTIVDPTSNITTVFNIGAGSNTFRWTISNALCNSYDDIVITNSTITTDAGLDASLCTDTAALSADNPAPGTGVWAIVNSAGSPVFDDASAYNTVVRNLASGANIFVWTATNGACSAWDIVTISNDVPTPSDAGLDQIVCDGTAVLQGNNPTVGTGVWTRLGGGGLIISPSNYNTLVTGLGSGGNTFRWTITEGMCVSYDDVLIMNELVFASAGIDDEICGDTYPELNGNQPGVGESGEWTVTGGTGVFADPTLYNTSVSGLSGSENRFTWTVTRGTCSNSDDVSIFDNTPSPASVSSDKEICVDFTVIAGNPPATGSGEWSVAAGSGVFDNSLANTTTVRQIGPDINIYRWTITNGTCTSSADIIITNNSVFSVVGDSINVCGPSAYLNGNEPEAGQTGIWTVTAGTGILANASLYNTQVINLNKGENKFRWTISNGTCEDYADLVVTNNLYDANASVAGPTTICVDSADLLGNIPVSGATGQWSIWAGGGFFDDPLSPTARVYGLLRGSNTLRWTITKNGCSNYDDVVITNNMVEALAGSDIITCGNDANLVANELYPGENGVWSLLSGTGTILTPSVNETVVTGLGAGVNVFRWSVSGNGCTAQDEVQVSENSFVTTAGFDQHVCDVTVALQAQDPSPGNGIWSFSGPGVVIVDPTSNTTTVNGLQDNSPHTFRWTVYKNGCQAWDEVVIYNDLVHAHAGGDQFVCTSNTTLSAENPIAGTGFWTISAGAGSVLDPTYYGSTVINLGLGSNTLIWTVTNLTCIDADQMIITNNTVTATAGADQQSCNSFTYLAGDQPQPGGNGLWETAGGPGIVETPTLFNSYVSGLQRGVNTFRWTVYENGCDNGGDLVQIWNNSFDAEAGSDQTLAQYDTDTYFEADPLDPNETGQWSILAGSGNILTLTDPTSYVDNLPTGENIFTWTVNNSTTGCSDSDDVSIIVADFTLDCGTSPKIICTNSVAMNAEYESGVLPINHTWSVVTGGGVFDDIHDPNSMVTNIPLGTNIYKWTVSFVGFSASCNVEVTFDSIFVSAGDDAEHCEDYHTMNAQQILGGTGLWSVIGFGGGTIVDNTLNNTLVTDLEPGDNLFEWWTVRDYSGCESRDTVLIRYTLPPIADFETYPTEFCAPQEVTIDNTSGSFPGYSEGHVFRWSIEGEFLGETYDVDEDILHTFTNTGTLDSIFMIQLVAIDTITGCTDTIVKFITAHPVPYIQFDPSAHEKRYPDATFGFANNSDQTLNEYTWDFGDGDNAYFDYWEGYVEHIYSTWGTYVITLTGTSGGQCDGMYTDTIVILPPCPYSYTEGSIVATGCQELTVELSANVEFADSIEWRFFGDYSNLDQVSNEENPVYTYEEAGEFYPTMRAWSEGCDITYYRKDTVIVYERPIVDFDVSPRLIMIPNQAIHCYNYSQFGDRYLWDFGDTISFEEEPLHYYTEPGVYDISLSVWSEHDCFDSLVISNIVFAEEPGMIKFPNAFTPSPSGPNGGIYPCSGYQINNENPNDVFHPLHSGVVDYQLEIYNRWGEKIFITNDICVGWDGYVDGVMAPQDVYVWKVSVIYKNGEPYKEYGSVTLLR